MFYSLIDSPSALYEVAQRGTRWELYVFRAFRKKFKNYPEYEYCYTVFMDNAACKLPMP